MPEILLDVTPELQERVNFWSRRSNEEPDKFLKSIITEYLEDLEDYEEAVRIHSEIQTGRMSTHSWEEVRERLGLEN